MFLVMVTLIVVVMVVVGIINNLRDYKDGKLLLPICRSWKWLPEFMRSLAPYDRLICSNKRCCCHKEASESDAQECSEKSEKVDHQKDLENQVIQKEPERISQVKVELSAL